jgi:hypothetical protein
MFPSFQSISVPVLPPRFFPSRWIGKPTVGAYQYRFEVDAVLGELAFTLHLETALNLLSQDTEISRRSISHRPSIADGQDRHRSDWTQLIDWVRDSYFAVKGVAPKRRAALLRIWIASDHALFRRLSIHGVHFSRDE